MIGRRRPRRLAMNTTSISIPSDFAAQRATDLQGLPIEQFVKASLEAAVRSTKTRDPFFADNTIFNGSTPANLTARHDDYLDDSSP
jgi:hypothetical protein